MAILSIVSGSNWNFIFLVFVEGGKLENPEKNPRSMDDNRQQTQPTYDPECFNHCAILATLNINFMFVLLNNELGLQVYSIEKEIHICSLQINSGDKTKFEYSLTSLCDHLP